ncbi:hypothetical protein AMTRI_Chr11g157050 [Amborella trichopoda]
MEHRSDNACLWLVSCLLLLVIMAGGVLLALDIAMPESESTQWFRPTGMVLVGIPWFFWFTTALYRVFLHDNPRKSSSPAAGARSSLDSAAPAPQAGPGAHADGHVGSEGMEEDNDSQRGRRVRFGQVIVMGPNAKGKGGCEGEGDGDGTAAPVERTEGSVSQNAMASSSSSSDGVSCVASASLSRECELPLTSAMSSSS